MIIIIFVEMENDNVDMDIDIEFFAEVEIENIQVNENQLEKNIIVSIDTIVENEPIKVVQNKRKYGIETAVKNLKRSWNILNKLEFNNLDSFEKMLITKMCNESITKLKKIKKEL